MKTPPKSGMMPPTVNEIIEANAACTHYQLSQRTMHVSGHLQSTEVRERHSCYSIYT